MKAKAFSILLSALTLIFVTPVNAALIEYSWTGTVTGNNTDGSVFVSLTWDGSSIIDGTAFVGGFDIYTSTSLNLISNSDQYIYFSNPNPGTDDIIALHLYGIFYSAPPTDYTFDNRTTVQTNYFGWPNFNTTVDVNSIVVNELPAAVPVPATAWLFGSGLIGLIGVARQKRFNNG